MGLLLSETLVSIHPGRNRPHHEDEEATEASAAAQRGFNSALYSIQAASTCHQEVHRHFDREGIFGKGWRGEGHVSVPRLASHLSSVLIIFSSCETRSQCLRTWPYWMFFFFWNFSCLFFRPLRWFLAEWRIRRVIATYALGTGKSRKQTFSVRSLGQQAVNFYPSRCANCLSAFRCPFQIPAWLAKPLGPFAHWLLVAMSEEDACAAVAVCVGERPGSCLGEAISHSGTCGWCHRVLRA